MRQQLTDLRRVMEAAGVDACLVPTTDFHGSEYVNDYFKCREFLSGFTGSAGTLVVTKEDAALWTDGRYFIQAARQLEGSGIRLMKMNQPGVPGITEYLKKNLSYDSCLAFDGRVIDWNMGKMLESFFHVKYEEDLVGQIWKDRPLLRGKKIYALPEKVTGETSASKLSRLRQAMKKKGASYHLITSLEEIAWLYNLRGRDVTHTPVFFAFALITEEEDRLYLLDESFSQRKVFPYFQIFEDLRKLKDGKILLNGNVTSYAFVRAIPKEVEICDEPDPIEAMKAVKNPTEIRCTRNAHRKDGVAMVKFLFWLKSQVGKEKMTEISAADYLETCRKEEPGCFDLSFDTISGYGENGAIVHYAPSQETDKKLKAEGFLLVDSGGQYEDGTTDITRTIALGPLTEAMKRDYTTVLKANLNLAMAVFPKGTTGSQLDKVARKPLWERGLDFNHGTGHGVGHILSVHEGPNRISPRGGDWPILPGMITTDEPGVYKEGEYGIRLENELLCVEGREGLEFQALTLCPFDREAILPELLDEREIEYLNTYHRTVYETLAPELEPEIRQWLQKETRPILLNPLDGKRRI